MEEWIKNQTLTVGVLGVRVSVDDLPLMGGLGICIISVWFFYSVRREHRAIGTLLRDTYREIDKNVQLAYLTYQGIVHQLIFIDFGRGVKPIKSFKVEEEDGAHDAPIFRGLLKALFYLPIFSLAFLLVMDIVSLCVMEGVFSPSSKPRGFKAIYDPLDIVQYAFSVLLTGIVVVLCIRIVGFNNATNNLLSKFRNEVKEKSREPLLDEIQPDPANLNS